MSKLSVIVPYRNREAHLNTFIPAIKKKLKKDKIDYELIIVEQFLNRLLIEVNYLT